MRNWLAAAFAAVLMILPVGHASASGMPFDNWTETWVGLGEGPNGPQWTMDGFYSQSDDWELSDVTPSVLFEPFFVGDELFGWDISITIPNFVDPLPNKLIKIVFESSNPNKDYPLPWVTGIVAWDTPFGTGGEASSVVCPEDCDFLGGAAWITEEETLRYLEQWELHPNPDWEVVSVFVPAAFDPIGLHIITSSFGEVPEPGTLALLSVGLIGLGMAGRRRA